MRAATNGWEAAGEVISQQLDVGRDPGGGACAATAAAAAVAAEQGGEEAENCSVAGPSPTKWVLVGHSMGTVGIEMVSELPFVKNMTLQQ